MNPIDDSLTTVMNRMYESVMNHEENTDSPEYVKMRIVSANLKGLVNIILALDDHQEVISMDNKKLALGLLATADWLTEDLPESENEEHYD